jgi:hypothetical protein
LTVESLAGLQAEPLAGAVGKLEELVSQGSLAFLLGAGCSKCAGLPLTAELADGIAKSEILGQRSAEILAAIRAAFDGVGGANVEDFLSELVDWLAIGERRARRTGSPGLVVSERLTVTRAELRTAIVEAKKAIAGLVRAQGTIDCHRRFVAAVHRPARAGRRTARDSVDYLVLNYDTLLEDALGLERIAYTDGLDGGETAWWNPDVFRRSDVLARVLKLHGSINWWEIPNDPLPRRVGARLAIGDAVEREVLIWPASTKYRETRLDPYAQLLEIARDVLRPGRGSQRVLVLCGYSFGDEHINSEIERGLRQSSGNLTIAAFTSDPEPSGTLQRWRSDRELRDQVVVFARRGYFHATQESRTEVDLPWWKFEVLTRLLEGER